MTPTDRACLQYAAQVYWGLEQAYVTPFGKLAFPDEMHNLNPSGDPHDAVIVTLAQMMKLHLSGVEFGQLRDDLLGSGVGEQFANRVHDHLIEVFPEEWASLRARVRWYADDMGNPSDGSTILQGET